MVPERLTASVCKLPEVAFWQRGCPTMVIGPATAPENVSRVTLPRVLTGEPFVQLAP